MVLGIADHKSSGMLNQLSDESFRSFIRCVHSELKAGRLSDRTNLACVKVEIECLQYLHHLSPCCSNGSKGWRSSPLLDRNAVYVTVSPSS